MGRRGVLDEVQCLSSSDQLLQCISSPILEVSEYCDHTHVMQVLYVKVVQVTIIKNIPFVILKQMLIISLQIHAVMMK